MTGSEIGAAAGNRRYLRLAGIAGLAAPVLWAVAAAMELARADIGHSIISRPERFFNDSAWHWPIVLLVAALVAAQIAATAGLFWARPLRRPEAGVGAFLVVALLARLAMALLLPSDPGGYSITWAAALCSNVILVALPVALVLAAISIWRRSASLALISAGAAIAMMWVVLWATTWSARSGASQPQLLAVEPVECLASLWAAVAGAYLLGRPARLRWPIHLPAIPAPGRISAALLAVIAIVGIVSASGSFVQAYRPTIEAQLGGSTRVETIHADAVDRTYRVHRPANEAVRPGLVIVLHGSFGGGFQMEASSGFNAQADRLGWVAVYPDGVADGWDTFGSTTKWGRHPGADDIAFISAVIDRMEVVDGVDPNRVYVTGMSRGGMMSYRLGCDLSDRLAAIAPVSGDMADVSGSADVPCPVSHPVSVFAIHGTADHAIPIDGGRVDINYSPMADVIARWRSLDSCGASSATATDGPSTTTVWSCAGGSTVSMRIVTGGWHTWPSVSGALASAGGSPDSFDASRLIADFFVAHPRVAAGG